VADDAIGTANCVLFATRFGPSKNPDRVVLPGLDSSLFSHLDALTIEEEDEGDSIRFFGAAFRSSPENLRPLILASAEDATGQILIANFDRATAYAPYDGGADVFLPTQSELAAARRNWAQWLSGREDGL
ncbi:MAG: hypothetical protein NTW61_03180, partial [Candidatus Melainabacteria bacterium]|nr:hypothetical protein [Candidatus Melainabacteria bacterium]